MASVNIASPPTDDPYKPFAFVNFVILTYSLGYDNFNYSFFLTTKNKPVVEYRKANDKSFAIRIVHGGFFTDCPGKAYQQNKVHFISHVNIDSLDMELLGRFSRSLGYTSLGNWYHTPIREHSGL
ncbi:unnamed protein product [Lactuca saligna]|uniref:Uncharacterized protein n=1 Tax=Lactuca saligna TaxID=75948 RepID=A0AA35ZWE6_LACSI|nr:unnamed protein product [Lactuca saligna]